MSELKVILKDLRFLFIQQIPSSIYLFFIGLSASILSIVFDKTDAGKNASDFLNAIASGLTQFNVFISVALIFLFLSSLQSIFTENERRESINSLSERSEDSFPKGLGMRSIAVNGLFSFLVPLVSLLLGMAFVMIALLYANPKLAIAQKVTNKSIFELGASAFLLLNFLVLFYFLSTWESIAENKFFRIIINIMLLFLIIVSFFEITK